MVNEDKIEELLFTLVEDVSYIKGRMEPSIVAINKLCATLLCDPNELLDLGYDITE